MDANAVYQPLEKARLILCAIFITQMSLIKNEFAPVTFRFGFVEASFPSLCDAFEQWHRDIDAKFAVKTEFSNISSRPLRLRF